MTIGSRLALGLMSGTSMDGIDVALVEVEESGVSMRPALVAFRTYPYPDSIEGKIRAAHDLSTGELARLHWDVGRAFGAAAARLLEEAAVDSRAVSVVGSHGQTVFHDPPRATLQIGEASAIRETTGIATVADFRTADLAAGGEGAPLVPWVDWILYRAPGRVRLAQNIGGIANVTVVTHDEDGVFAFDTGPGNMLIDRTVRELTGWSCDTGGEIAARGRPDIQTVRAWLEDPFFRRDPPRSTGRELFGDPFYRRTAADTAGLSAEDRVATVTWFTALSIAKSYEDFVGRADEVILSGGGARNPTLVGYLESLLAPLPVVPSDAHGLATGAKEALAFALLGLACLDGVPANVPRATGARRRVVLGKIVR